MAKYICLSLFLLSAALSLHAQDPVDTTLQLGEVLVTESRLPISSVGSKEQLLDSATLSLMPVTNLAEALALQTPIFIKNYGPSRSATSSIRGAGAGHTAVLWNGFNIQSPMLGQTDLSLLPVMLADEVVLEYGGGSALWGSGPIGGIVHLNSRVRFGDELGVGLRSVAGSFGQFYQGLDLSYSGGKFINKTKGFYQTAQNDFSYSDGNGQERNLPNAALRQYGFLQENYLQLPGNQQLGIQAWYQHAEREQPPTTLEENSEAKQTDDWLRLLLNWQRTGHKLDLFARAGLFRDRLQYENPAFALDTDDRMTTLVGEVEGRLQITPWQRLNFGINNTNARAESVSYEKDPSQNRLGFFLGYSFLSQSGDWRLVLSARQELSETSNSPFAPSVEVNGRLWGQLRVKGAVSRNYRLPTLNDLYFSDPFGGGNPDLEAEEGWSQELGLSYGQNRGSFRWNASATGFNRNIVNWIIWLPDGNFFFSPENLQEVWSRGLEGSLAAGWRVDQLRIDLNARYEYVRSTNEVARFPLDPAVDKQLPYVPEQRLQSSLQIAYAGFNLTYWHSYTGRVYTEEDNSETLPAYDLADVRLGKTLTIGHFRGQLWGRVRNLWDQDYQVVAFYPMPGRQFEVGLQLGVIK